MLTLTITYAVWLGGGVWSTLKVVADLSGVVYGIRVVVRVVRRRVRARRELPWAEELPDQLVGAKWALPESRRLPESDDSCRNQSSP